MVLPPRRALPGTVPLRVLVALVLGACAGGAPDIEVGAARAGLPAGGASQIVVGVRNDGDGDDELVRASSPAAAAIEVHRTRIEEGRATMTELDGVTVPAGETVSFRPGGLHLMMVEPDESVREGGTFPLTLHFDRSGEHTVEVEVVPIAELVDGAPAE